MSLFLTPGWFVLGASVLLLAGLVGSVTRILGKSCSIRRRTLLIVVNGLAVLMLWMLLVQPASRRQPSRSAVLLTSGSDDSPGYEGSGLPVIAMGRQQQSGVTAVADFAALARKFPAINHLIVEGHGLPLRDWRQAGRWSIDFRPASLPDGFVDMAWSPLTVLGEDIKLSGQIHGPDTKGWRVRVLDPGGTTVAERALQDDSGFDFMLRPRMPGGVLFQLLAVDGLGEVRLRESVPVWVQRPSPPVTLMLLATPSFEARHLKNWLSANSAGLTLETRLAREIRRVESTGENPPDVELSDQNLKAIDLLIVDAGRLNDMGQASRRLIGKAVSAGLGLLVIGDPALSDEVRRGPLLTDFELQDVEDGSAATVALFDGSAESAPPPLRLSAGKAQTLLADDRSTPLMAIRQSGAGQVGISLLSDSYAWRAVDQTEMYGRVWQSAVARISRPLGNSLRLQQAADLLSLRDSVTVCEADSCRSQWLEQAGWTRFGDAEATLGVFAHDPEDWQAWRAQSNQAATRRVANRAPPSWAVESRLSPLFDLRLVWSLFLLMVAIIWLEQKLGDGR